MRCADWFATLSAHCRRWLRERAGGVVVQIAVAMPAITMLVGVGVDYARTQQTQTKLQHAVDMATLALAKFDSEYDDDKAAARRFIEANLQGDDIDLDTLSLTVDVTKTLNSKAASISAHVDTDLYFGQLLTLDSFTLGAYSEAQEIYQHMEISMVLDTSGSMDSNSKIENLRDAAKDFVDIMLDTEVNAEYTTVNIVPFAGEVRVGSDFESFIKVDQRSGWNGCVDHADMSLSGQVLTLAGHDASPDYLCLNASRTAKFRENDLEALKTYISGLNAEGWTSADVGAQWGLAALEPNWKPYLNGTVTAAPRGYDEDVAKVMVIMTDGAVNGPYRKDAWGNWYEVYGSTFAKERFRSLCTTAKSRGVEIFTIGFEVDTGWMLDLLEECASSGQNYFEAEGAEISEVFQSIAFRLAPLRLVQ